MIHDRRHILPRKPRPMRRSDPPYKPLYITPVREGIEAFPTTNILIHTTNLLIGTKNPGKIEGAMEAFKLYFETVEIEGIPVDSGVSNEPVNDETYQGAKNRVDNLIKYAKKHKLHADYFLAVESGIVNLFGKWVIMNVAVIKDNSGYESVGVGPAYPVPLKYVDEIISTELGTVMDKIFDEKDLKSSVGGIGNLTNGQITRIDLTKSAFIMALTQFINKDIWSDK